MEHENEREASEHPDIAGRQPAAWQPLSPAEARAEIERQGMSLRAWAKMNGYSPATVARILRGEDRCRIGMGHKIAVALGLKPFVRPQRKLTRTHGDASGAVK